LAHESEERAPTSPLPEVSSANSEELSRAARKAKARSFWQSIVEADLPERIDAAAAELKSIGSLYPDLAASGFSGNDRAQMFTLESLASFNRARLWLSQWPKATFGPGTSYGLKHIAEFHIGYVANGVFIAAAVAEGFATERIGPNARIKIAASAWRLPAWMKECA
jgi:hypothetical protein